MKITRSIRLPEDILKAVAWLQARRGDDTSEAIRRLVRKGLEQEMCELYARGEVSLRQTAEVLSVSVRDSLELLWRHGVQGNITMSQALDALAVSERLAGGSTECT
ncbi:MAG: ribbon-helix-helix protein, CopG family [Armatimonadetes bacterium]|nr:ribbon-helix-helix protein, CopG family [Armatimonadota bacterium]